MSVRRFYSFAAAFGCVIVFIVVGANCDDNPYRHVAILDGDGKYNLEWVVDWQSRKVTFNVTVKTTGYVGFGLSRKGRMSGSDLVVGGVGKDGKPYFSDRYATGNTIPKVDTSQDWTLLSAWERGNVTSLRFSRAFDTCDPDHDMLISNDLTALIYAYGETDELIYHFKHRGWYNAYLLDPDLTPRSTATIKDGTSKSEVKVFTLRKEIELRKQDMEYWCTFHKVPVPKKTKTHIVGFNVTFPTDSDRRRVHRVSLHRCRAPPGWSQDEFLGPAAKSNGSECYILDASNSLPVPYCREIIYFWAVNSKPVFIPGHAGIILDTNKGQDEYLMIQAHYDNPETKKVPVTIELDVFYTEKLRQYNVGALQVGNLQPGATTVLIPSMSQNQVVMGHCAGGCTKRMFPPDGIRIFATLLHTHMSGSGVRALHLRDDMELPWIQADDNYNSNFQQFRILNQEVEVLPGDQIITRCTYDSTNRNGTTIHGGFSSKEEVCLAFMWYYSHSPGFAQCASEIQTKEYNEELLGIKNMTWVQSLRQMVITSPPQLTGITIDRHVNKNIKWNLDMRRKLQAAQIYEPQVSQCPRFHYKDHVTQLREQLDSGILEKTGKLPGSDGKVYTSVDKKFEYVSKYPRNIKPYQKPPKCTKKPKKQ